MPHPRLSGGPGRMLVAGRFALAPITSHVQYPRAEVRFLSTKRSPPVTPTRRSGRCVGGSPPLGSPERAHHPERGAVPLIPSLRREEDPLLAPLSLQVRTQRRAGPREDVKRPVHHPPKTRIPPEARDEKRVGETEWGGTLRQQKRLPVSAIGERRVGKPTSGLGPGDGKEHRRERHDRGMLRHERRGAIVVPGVARRAE